MGWDVAVLEFRLRRFGLSTSSVDGRFTAGTAAALRRFQGRRGLAPDGIAGPKTYRALTGRAPTVWHVVRPGESFFSISARYHVSPWRLAQRNRIALTSVIVPGQRLALPRGARVQASPAAGPPASRDTVRAAIDYWAGVYGVDPKLARALAWMESGFQQDVVSSVGAIGVMQLLPETWEFVDVVLLGVRTPRDYRGNVRAGVRYLRWQLDEFDGNVRLALAGWYQGATGGARAGALRRHEGVRPDRAGALRHGLSERPNGGEGAPRRLVGREAPEELRRREDLDVEEAVPARVPERADELRRSRPAFARKDAVGSARVLGLVGDVEPRHSVGDRRERRWVVVPEVVRVGHDPDVGKSGFCRAGRARPRRC